MPALVEPVDIAVFFTLILLEGVLSLDNAAIIAAMARRLPPEQRRSALLYGLIGAYAFRIVAIVGAAAIINNHYLQLVAGGYLVFLAVKHFIHVQTHQAAGSVKVTTILGLSAFWSTVVFIELADIAFALDQIVVAVAFTDKILIIIAAAMVAILLLRLSAFYLSRLMDWFPALEHIAYLVVGMVGLKIAAEFFFDYHVPEQVSAPITIGMFLIPVLVKLARDRWTKAPSGVL